MHFDNRSEWGENESYVYDFSGEGNNGSCDEGSGYCPTWNVTGGYFAGAFEFDGDDDYVEIPEDDSLDMGLKNFTVSLWIKTPNTGNYEI